MPQQNVIGGMFGLTPYDMQQQQSMLQDRQAAAMSGMPMNQLSRYLAGRAGGMAAEPVAGMLGMVNPQIEQAKQREALMSQQGTDLQSAEGLMAKAEQFRQAGDFRTAFSLSQLAQQKRAEQQQMMLAAQKAALAERKQEFQETEAMDLKRQQLAQQFEVAKMRSEDTRLGIDQRRQAAQEANQIRLMLGQMMAESRKATQAGQKPPTGYRWTPDGNLEPIPGGPKDLSQKNKAISETAEMKAKIVTDKVDEALKETGFLSTGLTGTLLGNIPGTKAYNLDKTIDTIKANIGFNELQAMRQASPTGGALGQVAVRELDMLQSVIASLDKGQSEEKLRNSLTQVRQHYANWKRAVDQAAAQEGGQELSSSSQNWKASSPNEVKALYKSGRISRDQAKAILKDMGF